LHLPKGLQYISAVGKFHLAAHREECFAKFSLNFVEGAGQQDGEILETLWSNLNKSAGSTRAMTTPHRQEMVDAHILDSNWKKHMNIGMFYSCYQSTLTFIYESIVNSLKRKIAKALPAMQQSVDMFQELDKSLDSKTRKVWQAQEDKAMKNRAHYLSVYNVKSEKGEFLPQRSIARSITHVML
jgi:choline dehydrogenase-like flavoprotein